jgi:hypothetical protein
MITFVPADITIWVNTPHSEEVSKITGEKHGVAKVLYIQQIRGDNDTWCCAHQYSGMIKHYDTLHLNLAMSFRDEINLKNNQPIFPVGL